MESRAVGFIFISVVLFPVVYATIPCDFPAIFNFGDSNSDTGTNAVTSGPHAAPNGESYFGSPAQRASDGRLIIDFIAESLGFPYLNAYLDALRSNFTHGANFASGGAGIRPRTNMYMSPFSLKVQFRQFYDFHHRPQKPLDQVFRALLPKPEDFSRALYILDIGLNDMSGLFDMSKDDVTTNIDDLVDEFVEVLEDIYWEGGRSFWIHNVGPYGCLASVLDTIQNTSKKIDQAGCSIHHNEVVQKFNCKLKEAVVQLRKNFPLAAFTYVDIYRAKYTLFSQAKKHGFEDPLKVCCGYGGKYNFNGYHFCGTSVPINGIPVFAGKCKDPSVRIDWDGVHYTQAANKWVFNQIVNGSYSDPPIPLKMACHKHY